MVNATSSIANNAAISLFGLNDAVRQVTLSTQRLATGDRLTRAGDDVGALTQSMKMQTEITALRQALENATQADSFLQTAYNGLSNINDILTDMKALAVQSSSGSLTAADRANLELEFQELSDEIDSIANNTEFNDIALLDGTISEENRVTTPNSAATQAEASLSFSVNIGAGETIVLNGVTFTEGTEFSAGGGINASLLNLASAINSSTDTDVNNITASVSGSTLTLKDRAGGELGFANIVDEGTSTASFTTTGGTTADANKYSLDNGANDGLTINSVYGSGTIGDALVNTFAQTAASITLDNYTGTNIVAADTFSIDDGDGGTLAFTFRTSPATSTEVQLGSDSTESLENLVETINEYTGAEEFVIDQLDFIVTGTEMTIRSKRPGNPEDVNGNALDFLESMGGTLLSSATLNNGVNTGVNASGVTNADFIGTVSGFSATYNSADDITVDITVGDYTYRAEINDTTPAANTFSRFTSTTDGGGYFDVEIASGGLAVANQTDANTFASRLDAALGGLTFTQNRYATSYTGTGDLAGSTFEFRLDDFANVDVESISVTEAPTASGDAIVEFTVNGETFRSNSDPGTTISEYEVIELASTSTSNVLTLRMGDQSVDLSTASGAADFEEDLAESFGRGEGTGTVSFQIGAQSTNTLEMNIGSATTDKLFSGQSINVLTQSAAGTAETVIDEALTEVGELMATVGSYQARLDFTSNDLSNQILYKDEARGALADTDVAEESTSLALATVQSQTAIAVLAQTNSFANNLLMLVNPSTA